MRYRKFSMILVLATVGCGTSSPPTFSNVVPAVPGTASTPSFPPSTEVVTTAPIVDYSMLPILKTTYLEFQDEVKKLSPDELKKKYEGHRIEMTATVYDATVNTVDGQPMVFLNREGDYRRFPKSDWKRLEGACLGQEIVFRWVYGVSPPELVSLGKSPAIGLTGETLAEFRADPKAFVAKHEKKPFMVKGKLVEAIKKDNQYELLISLNDNPSKPADIIHAVCACCENEEYRKPLASLKAGQTVKIIGECAGSSDDFWLWSSRLLSE